MTEEELRGRMYPIIYQAYDESIGITEALNLILTLIREAGWKSPEEVITMMEPSFFLAMDILQSDQYREPDIRDNVDNILLNYQVLKEAK